MIDVPTTQSVGTSSGNELMTSPGPALKAETIVSFSLRSRCVADGGVKYFFAKWLAGILINLTGCEAPANM